MPTNIGSQTVTLLFHTAANSLEWNTRYVGIRKKGIYSGGWLSIVNSTTAQISSLICEIADSDYQVRVKTSAVVNITVDSTIPYIVLRWTYTGSAANDYMDLLAVATPAINDIIVGKCTFDGSLNLNGFNYGDVTYPRSNPAVQDLFLKVEETGDSDLRVRIRHGRIQTSSGNIDIPDQKSDLFIAPVANSKKYLIYIDTSDGTIHIDSTGTAAINPVAPDYGGKLVLAEVTLASTDTSIPQSKIMDVRNFISFMLVPDGTSIEKNATTGKMQAKIVQVVNYQTGAVATGSAAIPFDDSIPQNTEGTQFMSLNITPTSATNKLRIDVVFCFGASGYGPNYCCALFKNSDSNALACCAMSKGDDANAIDEIKFTHYMVAGTTSAITFKVRAGARNVETITFNGASGVRKYGGVMASSITITEITD